MRKTGSTRRRLARARTIPIIAIAVLAAAFGTAAVAKIGGRAAKSGGGGENGPAAGASAPSGKTSSTRPKRRSENAGKPSASDQEFPLSSFPTVLPAVYVGDVRDLPYVAQTDPNRPEYDDLEFSKPELFGPSFEQPNI